MTPIPELLALRDVCARLDSAGIAYMLTGSLGADYHADTGARPWNIIHVPSVVKIDLIPRKDTVYRRAEFERRRRVELAGVPLWIVSIEDLILSKLEWSRESHSEQQRRDVGLLLEAPLDRAYLDEWAVRLGLDGLLKEAGNE